MITTALIGILFPLASAAIYLVVGLVLSRREVVAPAALAKSAFAAWWFGLAATSGLAAVTTVLAFAGVSQASAFVVLTLVNMLAISVALWGLLYYIVYLFTGNRAWLWPTAVLYAAGFFVLVTYVLVGSPSGVDIVAGRAEIVYAQPHSSLWTLALVVLVIVPPFLGALALLAFSFRVGDGAPRLRLVVVSISIAVWFGVSIATSLTGVSSALGWQLTNRLLGLASAVAILAAYSPLARPWLGARTAADPTDGG